MLDAAQIGYSPSLLKCCEYLVRVSTTDYHARDRLTSGSGMLNWTVDKAAGFRMIQALYKPQPHCG